jgi:hypothetical protein
MAAVTSPTPRILGFPDPVNEVAARVVAAGVALLSWTVVATGWHWLLVPLAYGFWARVLTGPTLSPLGRLAVRVVAPRLAPPKLVPGPPKRFAQGIGAALSSAALVAWLAGAPGAATVLIGMIGVAATLEAVFALCLGCRIFAGLMRLGVIPQSVCEACNNFGARAGASAS